MKNKVQPIIGCLLALIFVVLLVYWSIMELASLAAP
jgi:hypothetical protein